MTGEITVDKESWQCVEVAVRFLLNGFAGGLPCKSTLPIDTSAS